jgi:hypothetical protein
MYRFMASFYNKITNNVSHELERRVYVSFDNSCFCGIAHLYKENIDFLFRNKKDNKHLL